MPVQENWLVSGLYPFRPLANKFQTAWAISVCLIININRAAPLPHAPDQVDPPENDPADFRIVPAADGFSLMFYFRAVSAPAPDPAAT